ncbi:MAG TPA: vitamin K epoxide reductase family protein [Patescibacteria group bacterium]|nr:vitamin K epoxide reductase family protein [Patescibacteria group bacterium]
MPMKVNILNRITFLLSLFGLIIAVYVLQSWLRHTTIVCLTGGCETVKKSIYSYPFGVPVPAVGLVGYSIIAVLSFLRTVNHALSTKLLTPILGIAAFGVLFVSWFTYTEIFIIHGVCMWCAISAVNMLVIFILTVTNFLRRNSP